MKLINDAKLTAFDIQVLTTINLSTAGWEFDNNRATHIEFGDFKRSLLGWGMQQQGNRDRNHYRRLSWRGQIRMRQTYDAIMASPIELATPKEEKPEPAPTYNPNQLARALQGQQATPTVEETIRRLQYQLQQAQATAEQGSLRGKTAIARQALGLSGWNGYTPEQLVGAGLDEQDLRRLEYCHNRGFPEATPNDTLKRLHAAVDKLGG